MENIIKQIKKGAKQTHLTPLEKSEIRSALLRHVKASPVSGAAFSGAILSLFSISNFRNKKTISAFVIGGLLFGSSVSFAAEGTVPGDALFPIKIHVNEAVRGAMMVSPKAKADWEIQLGKRRLEEVEKLAASPILVPQAQHEAQQNLVSYTQHVEDRISKLESDNDGENALDVAASLSNLLDVHEQILRGLSSDDKDLEKVREFRGEAEKKHKDLMVKYYKEDNEVNGGNQDVPVGFVPSLTQASTTINSESDIPVVSSSVVRVGGHEDTIKSPDGIVEAKQYEEKRNFNEEIRSTPTTQSEDVTPVAPTQSVESHPESKRSNEGDR